ncbi:MAG: class I SAM-dependent methyltransferase [Aeromicrobium sp.]
MRPGEESQTAILVCMSRALADSDDSIPWFRDPTAFELLPDDARERVTAIREERPGESAKDVVFRRYLRRQAKVVAARTQAIDDVVRSASFDQVVLLGAGLDGRGYRLDTLADAIVYEVDHPDSQARKRERARRLRPVGREIRFVAVDFASDDLNDALTAAGHDPGLSTVWVWEGVVMYLDVPTIEVTLDVIAQRSAPGSRIALLYTSRSPMVHVVNLLVKRLGEPFRSSFRPVSMRRLLGRYGFGVDDDRSLDRIGAGLGTPTAEATARVTRHQRIASATKHG